MPQHRIYLASSYLNKDRVRFVAGFLAEAGHKVTSTWIDENWPLDVRVSDVPDDVRKMYAQNGIYEILDSDVFVHFRREDEPYFRAGSSVEYGMALMCVVLHSILASAGEVVPKRVILVGNRINIFDDLPLVRHFPTEAEFLEWAKEEAER